MNICMLGLDFVTVLVWDFLKVFFWQAKFNYSLIKSELLYSCFIDAVIKIV